MSTTSGPAPQRFYATLDAPHASEPTEALPLWLYDVTPRPKRGRYRTRDLDHQARLMVPPLSTWTLDTLRMVLWEMSGFLDGAEDYHGDLAAFRDWVSVAEITTSVRCHYRGKPDRQQVSGCELWVELPTMAVRVYLDTLKMSAPMIAALVSLPATPLPLAAIDDPGSKVEGDAVNETLDDVRRQQRINRNLKELRYFDNNVYAAIDQVIENLRRQHGLGDD